MEGQYGNMQAQGRISGGLTRESPVRDREIPNVLGRFEAVINGQEQLISDLETRLAPLRNVTPSNPAGERLEKAGPACQLAAGLNNMASRVMVNNDRIRMLMESLEL